MFSIKCKLLDYNEDHSQVISETEVNVIAWDRDKYFLYEDANGVKHTTKRYWLSIKRTNKLHSLPYIDYSEDEYGLIAVTKKEATKEIKEGYKPTHKYHVGDKKFNSLKKSLAFFFGCNEESYLRYDFKEGNCWSSGPLMGKQGGEYHYYTPVPKSVSEKTLKNT